MELSVKCCKTAKTTTVYVRVLACELLSVFFVLKAT